MENTVSCKTPLLLKPSPKPKTPDRHQKEKYKAAEQPTLPLNRTPRGPPVDIGKKKVSLKNKSCEQIVSQP